MPGWKRSTSWSWEWRPPAKGSSTIPAGRTACVKLIVLTLAPKATPGAYLQAISSLAMICQDPSTADIVASLPTAEQVWAFFDKGGMVLPDHLRAADVMDPVQVKLQEHDTLERAIDLFVRHRLNELPVVDKDGDLIGVVSTYELLRVCLPDYILWMDDLTPILNFEPFAEILRKESKTWLAEIMTTDYATVEADRSGDPGGQGDHPAADEPGLRRPAARSCWASRHWRHF